MILKLFILGLTTLQLIGWSKFEGTSFRWEYVEAEGAEIQLPTFPAKVTSIEGLEMELSGFFLPLEMGSNNIVISKMPYSSCFFCGGDVGAETVAEIQFIRTPPHFSLDQIVHVKGRLKLNERDLDHLTFILTDAVLISK
ncbi:MAG: hypothetical protein AAFR87_17415 [Bacteroidota bacterium]